MPKDRPIVLLLVEDDEGDALIVREELADAAPATGIEWVRSLAEAEARLPGEVSCVLLDLGLPDAVGLEALRRLRSRAPDTAIIVLTGHGDEQQGIAALGTGAQDYLVKGTVDGALLARAIRYAVERRRAERSQVALREAQLHAGENRRLERGLLPTPILTDDRLRVGSGYRPGRRRVLLGGDFYDVVERPDGRVEVLIGDVSGHSADEAAVGVHLRIAFRSLTLAGLGPEEVLGTLHGLLVHERHYEEQYATAATLTLAPDRRRAELRLAGHPPPVLVAPDGGVSLLTGRAGPPLGAFDEPGPWPATQVELPPRWGLLAFTDGLVEGRVGAGSDRLGSEGLGALVDAHVGADPQWQHQPAGLVDRLIREVEALNGGPMHDDLAVLALTCTA